MDELHDSHPGIVSMKAIARSHVWWPGIDNDLESRIIACTTGQALCTFETSQKSSG